MVVMPLLPISFGVCVTYSYSCCILYIERYTESAGVQYKNTYRSHTSGADRIYRYDVSICVLKWYMEQGLID